MIQKETRLRVADNSGAKEVLCFHLLGSTGKQFAYIGDVIKCTVKSARPGGLVKKSDIVEAVIVRQVKPYRREDGSYISFSDNAVVIIKDGAMVGSSVSGPVAREIKKYADIASRALEVL